MSEREQIIAAIKAENIKQDGWELNILQRITDRYVLGVARTKMSQISDVYSYDEEEFREELIAVCERVPWQDPQPQFDVHKWASELRDRLNRMRDHYSADSDVLFGVVKAKQLVEKELQELTRHFTPPAA